MNRDVVAEYESGFSLGEAAACCGLTYKQGRERLLAAGVPLRSRGVVAPAQLDGSQRNVSAPVAGNVLVYALTDPETGRVYYVGQTCNPRARLSQHRWPDGKSPAQRRKREWIAGLAAKGLAPVLAALEEVDWRLRDEAEMEWIAYFRDRGEPLLNVSVGGHGWMLDPRPTRECLFQVGDCLCATWTLYGFPQRFTYGTLRVEKVWFVGNPEGYRLTLCLLNENGETTAGDTCDMWEKNIAGFVRRVDPPAPQKRGRSRTR